MLRIGTKCESNNLYIFAGQNTKREHGRKVQLGNVTAAKVSCQNMPAVTCFWNMLQPEFLLLATEYSRKYVYMLHLYWV